MRCGSASTSIAVIRPSRTTNPMIAVARPATKMTAPAVPLIGRGAHLALGSARNCAASLATADAPSARKTRQAARSRHATPRRDPAPTPAGRSRRCVRPRRMRRRPRAGWRCRRRESDPSARCAAGRGWPACGSPPVIRSTMGAIWSNGTVKTSCSTNASRSARRQRFQHHEQRHAHRVGQHRAVFGVEFAFGVHDRIRQMGDQLLRASAGAHATCSGRCGRPRWSARRRGCRYSSASGLRLSRSHASCTASSASSIEPSIR